MRIIFMGTPDFSVGTLEALVEAGHEVCLVVTQPDKPKGRGKEMQYTPVKEAALKHGIEVYQPRRIREAECVEKLRQYNADIMVVIAFGQIIPKEILEMVPYGCVNVHASLLPKYRGAAPIQWSIIDGEAVTGVTTMQMDEGLDTGDMLLKTVVPLDEKETGGSLFDKLSKAGADLLLLETQPSLREALVEAKIAEEMGADYWISFSCGDDKHINEGTKIAECARAFSRDPHKYPHLKMIGVNCTKPAYIVSLIREFRTATDLPIAVYPNSGEEYDPVTKTWHGTNDKRTFYDYALSYFQNGATAVGGCCTTVESHIRQVTQARRDFEKAGIILKMRKMVKKPLAISKK